MILLTRLNNKPMVVNADQIRSIEENPDTTLTLMNGDRVLVRETMEQVVDLVVEYQRRLRLFVGSQ